MLRPTVTLPSMSRLRLMRLSPRPRRSRRSLPLPRLRSRLLPPRPMTLVVSSTSSTMRPSRLSRRSLPRRLIGTTPSLPLTLPRLLSPTPRKQRMRPLRLSRTPRLTPRLSPMRPRLLLPSTSRRRAMLSRLMPSSSSPSRLRLMPWLSLTPPRRSWVPWFPMLIPLSRR